MDIADEIMMERLAAMREAYVSPPFQREDSDSPLLKHEDEIEREREAEARAEALKAAAEGAAAAKAAIEAGKTLTISTPPGSSDGSTPNSSAGATIASSTPSDTPAPPTYSEDVTAPAAPSSPLPPMFIRHPDGTEEVNPDAYIRRGYGWDGAHREEWAAQLERGHDYDSIPDPVLPTHRERSPRSRSHSDSPVAKRARTESSDSTLSSDSQRYSPNSPLPYSGTPSPSAQESPAATDDEDEAGEHVEEPVQQANGEDTEDENAGTN